MKLRPQNQSNTTQITCLLITLYLILMMPACSQKEENNPVSQGGMTYDSLTYVLIPAGSFLMGTSTDNPYGWSSEKPVHEVTISRPFLMGRTEVTQRLYKEVIRINPSYNRDNELPVETVTWSDAIEFCNALSLLEGLIPCYNISSTSVICDFTANGYRLPTEAEWEYACRAGTTTDYCSGNMENQYCTDSTLANVGWYCGNSNHTTQPVGLKAPNSFGLYDMHGNVQEWCWDWFERDYYSSSVAIDPRGPDHGTSRVHRGGSNDQTALGCRSAARAGSPASAASRECGFRVVRTQ